MEYPSGLVENAVDEIAKLPGIGRKTALRLVLHLLKQNEIETSNLTDALKKVRLETKYCKICHVISDTTECSCIRVNTDTSTICVVEDTPDVIAIKNTGQYNGMFHVLGGIISPMDGIGPDDLNINALVSRVEENKTEINEIILALSPTMEGDTTAYYITKKLKPYNLKITSIARGIPIGGELEYTDEVTLGRSIITRVNYEA